MPNRSVNYGTGMLPRLFGSCLLLSDLVRAPTITQLLRILSIPWGSDGQETLMSCTFVIKHSGVVPTGGRDVIRASLFQYVGQLFL